MNTLEPILVIGGTRGTGLLITASPTSAIYGLFLGSIWFLLFARRNGLQSNPAKLNPAPTDSSVTLSNRASKRETYKAAMTAVRSDLKPPATMVELANDFARDRDLEIRSLAIGALLSVEQYISAPERVSWAKLCGRMFRPMLDDIGIEPRPGESTNVPQFRASLLGALGLVAGDSEVVAHWRKIASEQISATNLTWRPEVYGPDTT